MITVTVVKRRWYRGQGGIDSRLRKEQGQKQCCIGFVARTLGAKARQLIGLCTLEELTISEAPRCYDFSIRNSQHLSNAYAINDADDISEDKRITKLTALGKKMGVTFKFV